MFLGNKQENNQDKVKWISIPIHFLPRTNIEQRPTFNNRFGIYFNYPNFSVNNISYLRDPVLEIEIPRRWYAYILNQLMPFIGLPIVCDWIIDGPKMKSNDTDYYK